MKKYSISRRLTISLIVTVAIVSIVAISSIYLNADRKAKRELEKQADEILQYLMGSLEIPLWLINDDTVRVIGKSVAQNELVVQLIIKDNLGIRIYFDEKEHGQDVINRSGQIFHKGEFLGEVEISLTKQFYQENSRNLLFSFCIIIVFVLASLVLVTGFFIRAFLKKPLHSLNEIVDSYAAGVYDSPVARLPYLEFQPFENVLAQMGDTIKNQLDALRKAHDELEVKVAERTAELAEAKERAEAANRAKSTFLAGMSHELRTPLNTILGFAQLLSRSPSMPEEYKENLFFIARSGEHLLSLINQVLDMSKIEAGRAELDEHDLDLGRLLDDLEQIFRSRARGKGLSFNVSRAADIPRYVRADEVRLRQVLINLLGNAVKYTTAGSITFRVYELNELNELNELSELSKTQKLKNSKTHKTHKTLRFDVEDTGPGIAPGELEHIFEAFAQTATGQAKHEGTGLGLTISRQFVELMGGELTVKSVVGAGSLFTFEIPVQVTQAPEIQSQEAHRQVIGLEPGQPCYRILVVDDVEDNRQLLVKLLASVGSPDQGSPGFHVREATNGQEALEIWETWQPHLIWMDMRMPAMDGYDATRRIREAEEQKLRSAEEQYSVSSDQYPVSSDQYPVSSDQYPVSSDQYRTPIIALTASAFEEQRSVVLAAGCDDFLRKPFREIDFFDMMGKYLGLRYVYATKPGDKTSRAKQIRLQMPFIVEALAALPDELLQELHNAVKEINLNNTQRIIGQIGKKNKALARELSHLLEDYRFDVLLGLVEETKK